MIELCNESYTRPGAGVPLRCQYLKEHPAERHSWFAVKLQDEVDAECLDDVPTDVSALLDAIISGKADPYLEAILAATHGRKRQLRGVRRPFGARS